MATPNKPLPPNPLKDWWCINTDGSAAGSWPNPPAGAPPSKCIGFKCPPGYNASWQDSGVAGVIDYYCTAPGQPVPGTPGAGPGPGPSPSPGPSGGGSPKKSEVPIAAIIGGIVGVSLAVAIAIYLVRKHKREISAREA